MKKTIALVFIMAAVILCVRPAMAIDIETLDKVNVLMPKAEVKALLGEPDSTGDLILGLDADVYNLKGLEHMAGVGCIYDENDLVGLAYLFEGLSAADAIKRMETNGFIHYKTGDGVDRLIGKDDDTQTPIVVVIIEEGGLTKAITFEKTFYEKTLKLKKSE